MTTPLEAVARWHQRLIEVPCEGPLPDGEYAGQWSGCVVRLYIGCVRFEVCTLSGVSGLDSAKLHVFQPQAETPCRVVVKDGVMTVTAEAA
jgi:hypothetical protein